jgi:hypothetical protein
MSSLIFIDLHLLSELSTIKDLSGQPIPPEPAKYPDPAIRDRSLQFKGHCGRPQGAWQSLTNGEIATLLSGLRLTAMT